MTRFTRDHIWVWDGPANNLGPSVYGLGEASRFFHANNIVCMWPSCMTVDTVALDKVRDFKKVAWEITRSLWVRKTFRFDGDDAPHLGYFMEDSWSAGRGWESKEGALRVSELSRAYPNLAGGLLDYSFGGFHSRGGTPEHLKEITQALKRHNPCLQLIWMVYTNDLDPKWEAYLPWIDVVCLWEPKRANLANLDASIARCSAVCPGKPILLGLYLVDYWARRMNAITDDKLQWHTEWALEPMPPDLLELECTQAVRFVEQGRVAGLALLAESMLDKFPETAAWVRKFLEARLEG